MGREEDRDYSTLVLLSGATYPADSLSVERDLAAVFGQRRPNTTDCRPQLPRQFTTLELRRGQNHS